MSEKIKVKLKGFDPAPHVVFWVERRPDGRPDQLWNHGAKESVFLHDRFEIVENKNEAERLYYKLAFNESTHAAGFSRIETSTDWT